MSRLKSILCVCCLSILAACGSTATGGAASLPGGKPGVDECNATATPVGCFSDGSNGTTQVVSCVPGVAPTKWGASQVCAAGTHCALKDKNTAECVNNSVVVVQDTVGSTDSCTKESGDTGSTADSLGCVKSKCPAQYSAYLSNAVVANLFNCLSTCCVNDINCEITCNAPLKKDATASKILDDLATCAETACPSVPSGDASSSMDGFSMDTASQDMAGATPYCLDGICQATESMEKCAFDCAPYKGWLDKTCMVKTCSSELATCKGDPGCISMMNCLIDCDPGDVNCVTSCDSAVSGAASTAASDCAWNCMK